MVNFYFSQVHTTNIVHCSEKLDTLIIHQVYLTSQYLGWYNIINYYYL